MNNIKKQRLSKVMAAAGVASRRACEELIFAGKVKVNQTTVLVPQTMVSSEDIITVNNQALTHAQQKKYYILNKPCGYVCSTRGNPKTKLVLDLFEEVEERLFTVGRLDKDTEGLLIVTNDGHFANTVIHPSSNVNKEYLAKTDQDITPEHLMAIANGTLVEGSYVKPIRVKKVRKGTLRITLAEGKKREVRILLEMAGLEVKQLMRIRIGGLHLGALPVGQWRPMTEQEKHSIFH